MQTLAFLKKLSAESGRDMSLVAQTLVRQAFLRRVFESAFAERFACKGGSLVMLVEGLGPLGGRTTSDVDMVIPGFSGNLDDLRSILVQVLSGEQGDGVSFDLDSYRVTAEREAGTIGGGSVKVTALVAGQKVGLKMDVTFDERTSRDELVESDYPMLAGGTIRIRHVPLSHLAADKIQAMIRHGARNHRLRDHYDLYLMFKLGQVSLEDIARALPASLASFGLAMPEDVSGIPALSDLEAVRRNHAWEHEKVSRRFGVMTPSFEELNAYLRERVDIIIDYARQPELGMRA
jgi:hypothetical protein